MILPEQSPFPSEGKIYAFNGYVLGHPVIFAHIYGTEPLPTSFVLPFVVRHSNGEFATTLVAYLPKVKANWGFITGISLKLNRDFRYKGKDASLPDRLLPGAEGDLRRRLPLRESGIHLRRDDGQIDAERSCRAKG